MNNKNILAIIKQYGTITIKDYGTVVFARPSDDARFSASAEMILHMLNVWMWDEIQHVTR